MGSPQNFHPVGVSFPSQWLTFRHKKFGILGTKRKTNMPRKKLQFLRKSLWYLFLHSETNPLTRNNWSQNNSTTRKWIKSLEKPPKTLGTKTPNVGNLRTKKNTWPSRETKISHQSERKLIFLTAFVLGYVGSQDWLVVSTPFEKYESKWESSPGRGENKKYLKPPPRRGFCIL